MTSGSLVGTRRPVSTEDLQSLVSGRLSNTFALLGPHEGELWAYVPGANALSVIAGEQRRDLTPVDGFEGVFFGPVDGPYRLSATSHDGTTWEFDDPYRFGPVIGEMDEYLLGEGTHQRIWQVLGAHVMEHEGVWGTHFAVWAPNVARASVVGDFNVWDGRRHAMRARGATGVWEIFIPGIGDGTVYKYEFVTHDGTVLPLKADPVGFGSQHPPETASVVRDIAGYGWSDQSWMDRRAQANGRDAPISVYEVHVGSWRRIDGRPISYKEAAEALVDYVADMGFTHIELMPVSEHPFDGSWGYQPVGMFAPTIRFGPPHEFRDLMNAAHKRNIGVLLDWVPGHFPVDSHGLAQFDGTHLYEHADPKEGFHQDWNTLIYNFGRTEVTNYLISNALYWLEEYHLDGLRVDAVASMLYRDYSRKEGEWVPNKDGGRENYEAISLLQRVNTVTYGEVGGIMTVAEESTSFPAVSQPVDAGGLGFGYKWNMGWMNDTLSYMSQEPIHRKHHHNQMTFGMVYAFSENFVLPISHDEVVHGKGSMLAKMPGNDWEKFANLRAYYGFMWGHPGKKLLFMGQEFAQAQEWNHDAELDWGALADPSHKGIQNLVRALNGVYRRERALHATDTDPSGFAWIVADDADNSVFAWLRRTGDGDTIVVVCNLTPVARDGYQIGLPLAGEWVEILNSDAEDYGGAGRGNMGTITASAEPSHGQPAQASLYLPPLSTLYLKPRQEE